MMMSAMASPTPVISVRRIGETALGDQHVERDRERSETVRRARVCLR
jgi:hypothetical protein